ncbi:Fc.00g055240.m01.CDS01 [Cosmosporella sp. VM-42]
MKIVIIGAGIAGCAVYLELRKHLPELSSVTIYEEYSTVEDVTADQREQGPIHSSTLLVGGGLGIAPNGLGVLQRLDEGLLREVTCGGYVSSHSNLKNKNGNLLMRIEPNGPRSGSDADPAPYMHTVACSRHSLWRCLRTRIPNDHIMNKRVLNIVANAQGKNVVHFVDGSDPVEADLVIGADGVRSTTKRALFPESTQDPYPPHYEGLVGVGGFVPAADVKNFVEKGSMNFIFGGNGFFGYFFCDSDPSAPYRDSPFHISEPGESLAWWSTYEIKSCPDRKSLEMDDVVQQLRERHSQWKDPVVQKVLESVRVQNMYPTWTSPQLPLWDRDGVVLLGDAAHALPSSSGQGTSQALEDCEAFVLFLAHHLRKTKDAQTLTEVVDLKKAINAAAKQYVTLRQPRVTEILKAAQKIQNSKRSMGVIQEYTMYTFMKIFGLFPGLIAKPTRKLIEYNIAEHVVKVLAAEE